ncbi:hypothetical protein [Halomicrobium salinisoli]|uniref:hypothetical protein n=1 Tax=Halomicrobium salinisoli TaxID=2878391 RepID=UPI001CF0A8EA|nr:hypothetical protein [Halomicrobium salinisoli]
MDRLALAGVALIVVGAALVVTAPPDPQYSVSVSGPTEAPEDEPVVAFEDLSEENRTLFRESFDDGTRSGDPPPIESMYVEYEGETYEMAASAHEGPVLSLIQPPIGGIVALVGCLLLGYRYYRS